MVTKRQGEILLELGRGEITKTVADKLHISIHTAETHIKRAKKALKAKTVTEAVLKYVAMLDNPVKYLKEIKTTVVMIFIGIQSLTIIGGFDVDLRRLRNGNKTQNRIVRVARKTN